ncbi:DNA alkylation repair protein [Leucobacter iarius]|uniref:DNA alkylation repair protein n=1 Tax=Leucobacter iarius TaxID=333963 RepID=A0ABN2LMM0_9MICO
MPLADELLGADEAEALIAALAAAEPATGFAGLRAAAARLGELALSARARALAEALDADLDDGADRLNAVVRSATADPGFAGWMLWGVGLAVGRRAIDDGSDAAFDDGLALLRELTPRMTSEFSVRPMLRHDLHRALRTMADWTSDPDPHVRRLASEGTRPLLPWGERVPGLVEDPGLTRGILDALHDDPDEVVRRSVANHLNDHSRAHPGFAVEVVRGWQRRGGPHVARTASHALRTLVKRGDADALALLGFRAAEVEVSPIEIAERRIEPGGTVRFGAEIRNIGIESADLVIDYALFFPDSRGRERTKVFKIGRRTLAPGERTRVDASRSFRALTTRSYYPGDYGVALQVNGVAFERAAFAVRPEAIEN